MSNINQNVNNIVMSLYKMEKEIERKRHLTVLYFIKTFKQRKRKQRVRNKKQIFFLSITPPPPLSCQLMDATAQPFLNYSKQYTKIELFIKELSHVLHFLYLLLKNISKENNNKKYILKIVPSFLY